MSQESPTLVDQRFANLKALHRQLEEMAAKSRQNNRPEVEQRDRLEGAVLVIRGK